MGFSVRSLNANFTCYDLYALRLSIVNRPTSNYHPEMILTYNTCIHTRIHRPTHTYTHEQKHKDRAKEIECSTTRDDVEDHCSHRTSLDPFAISSHTKHRKCFFLAFYSFSYLFNKLLIVDLGLVLV